MNLVDSSGWLEYFSDGANADFFTGPIQESKELIVSTINIYEVFKKVLAERNEDAALQATAIMLQAGVISVDSQAALLAARLSGEHGLPMADSIILATAKLHRAILWTQDSDFRNFSEVRYIEKG